MIAISITGAGKDYNGVTVLDRVNLDIPQGICAALIGHNGAGKTTLMKLILGLIHPTRGSLTVLGATPGNADKEFRRQLGFLPENVVFHEQMTGADALAYFARLKGAGIREASRLMDRVGLARAAEQCIKTYSKGMRQRLGLAQALLGRPKLLLLDEPTTGLDPVLRQEFFGIIRDLTAGGVTVLLSSHILTEIEARTDLALIMRDGRLVASGDLNTLRQEAGLPLTVRIKGDVPAISKKLNGSFGKRLGSDPSVMDIDCPLPKKMSLLRTLAGFGDLCADVEVRQPGLDDLYLHYSGRRISTLQERWSKVQ
jgi:Cu-processing system ATP-binding protein